MAETVLTAWSHAALEDALCLGLTICLLVIKAEQSSGNQSRDCVELCASPLRNATAWSCDVCLFAIPASRTSFRGKADADAEVAVVAGTSIGG